MDVFVARQPILDTEQKIQGYELFYRNSLENVFPGTDEDEATSEVIIGTFQSIGLASITAGLPAFINFTRRLLEEQAATLVSRDQIVVEVLESVTADEAILARCRELKEAGYTLALDDYVYGRHQDAFLDLVDIVKIDLLTVTFAELEPMVKALQDRPLTLLAEKVESWEAYKRAKDLGFSLFQGYYFSRPEIMTAMGLTPVEITCLELIALLGARELDFERAVKIIARDLALTYGLMRLANSAAFMRRHPVRTIPEALVWIGEKEIRKWIALIALRRMSIGEQEAPIITSLVRGRFAELLAERTKWRNQRDQLFLGGVFSLLDVLLQRSFSTILDEIRVSPEIKELLLYGRGPYQDFGALVLAYEERRWEDVAVHGKKLGLKPAWIGQAYLSALEWCPYFG